MGPMVVRGHVGKSSPRWVRALLRRTEVRTILRIADADSVRRPSLHLVVVREPHLGRMLSGEKSVEARFCRVRRAPMGVVASGDVLLLKRAAGPIVAWCRAGDVLSVRLSGDWRDDLREAFDEPLAFPGEAFWASVRRARHATLIELLGVDQFERPLPCAKRDQRGWVVLRDSPA